VPGDDAAPPRASAAQTLAWAVRRLAAGRTLLVPALYCPDVHARLAAAGARPRTYDVGWDLAGDPRSLARELGPGTGAVLWLHPFGRFVPPPATGVPVIEDGCFSLAEALRRPGAHEPATLLVFSARKELRWTEGAVAAGPLARGLHGPGAPPPAGPAVARAWRTVRAGAAAGPRALPVSRVREALGDVLPAGHRPDGALSVLPLLSADRDGAVEALRAAGVSAWYWRDPLPGRDARRTPVAHELARRMFFVSVASRVPDVLTPLAGVPLERWPVPD
jgi:hypothetical protein